MRERHRGKAVMVRTDAASLSLIAFTKEEGDRVWTRCPDHHPIPRGIMLPDFSMPNWIGQPAGAASSEMDHDDSPHLIPNFSYGFSPLIGLITFFMIICFLITNPMAYPQRHFPSVSSQINPLLLSSFTHPLTYP
jgi:hypothetical protein